MTWLTRASRSISRASWQVMSPAVSNSTGQAKTRENFSYYMHILQVIRNIHMYSVHEVMALHACVSLY